MVLGVGSYTIVEYLLFALLKPPGDGMASHDRGRLLSPLRFGAEQAVELLRQGNMEIVSDRFHWIPPAVKL
jgi:hypothetical protein